MELTPTVAQLRSKVRDISKLVRSLEKIVAAAKKKERAKIAKVTRKAADT